MNHFKCKYLESCGDTSARRSVPEIVSNTLPQFLFEASAAEIWDAQYARCSPGDLRGEQLSIGVLLEGTYL